MSARALPFLSQAHAIWEYPGSGSHAVYALGGFHSDFYFNSDVLERETLEEFLRQFVLPKLSISQPVTHVVSYRPFGSAIAASIARSIGARLTLTDSPKSERLPDGIEPGSIALLVADDIHTGGSLSALSRTLTTHGIKLINQIVVLGNFSGSPKFKGREIISGFERPVSRWRSEQCPLCANGSKPLAHVRRDWDALTGGIEINICNALSSLE